jgi:hypothetical protein
MESDTTSHLRPSILTSFLTRSSRPRSTATSPTGAEPPGINGSNNSSQPINMGITNVSARRRAAAAAAAAAGGHSGSGTQPSAAGAVGAQSLIGQTPTPATSLPIIMPAPTATSFSQMLRRRRSNNGNLNANPLPASSPTPHSTVTVTPIATTTAGNNVQSGTLPVVTGPAHRIRLVPHLENSRALHFDPITRECRENAAPIRIGRFTDRSGTLAASTNSLTGKIAFKSKVVSRGHAELWCEANGKVHLSIFDVAIDCSWRARPSFM